jgi:hypothetical protein
MRRILLVSLILATASEHALGAKWKWVTDVDGIRVTKRNTGRGFPTFRGAGIVETHLFQVLAVISDISRHPQWVYHCKDARLLRKIDDKNRIVYARTAALWPVADRDAVYRSRAVVNTRKREVLIKFWAVSSNKMKRVKGVVRMVSLRGHYRLRALGKKRTYVEYQVDADPRGLIPKWMARIAVERLPLYTLQGLRKQTRRTKGRYDRRIRRWVTRYYPAALDKIVRR